MTTSSPDASTRAALPAVMTFFFGLAMGVVVGYVAWAGAQPEPAASAPRVGEATPPMGGAPASSADAPGGEVAAAGERPAHADGEDPAELHRRLELHEKLLAENPEDVRLLRTVGNYHGLLGQQDEAIAVYARAEALARKKNETTQLVEILTDQGVALAEKGDMAGSLAKLAEARSQAPSDTRSRLTEAVILMTRVMPNPPPGFDRKEAVTRAEALLKEVLAIQPGEPNATEMLDLISSIRTSMARGARPAGAPPAEGSAAPPAGSAQAPPIR